MLFSSSTFQLARCMREKRQLLALHGRLGSSLLAFDRSLTRRQALLGSPLRFCRSSGQGLDWRWMIPPGSKEMIYIGTGPGSVEEGVIFFYSDGYLFLFSLLFFSLLYTFCTLLSSIHSLLDTQAAALCVDLQSGYTFTLTQLQVC